MNLRRPAIRCPMSARKWLLKAGLTSIARGTAVHPTTGQVHNRVWVTNGGPWAPGSGKTLVQAARSFQRFVVNR